MHDHLDESDGRDTDVFEVVWIAAPWASIVFGFYGDGIVSVERVALWICESDGVLELLRRVLVYVAAEG